MAASCFWSELTTTDLSRSDMSTWIAVLPFAATEQHGPHLPLGTDTFIMEGYLARVCVLLPAAVPAVFLPTQSIGCSVEHSGFAGTLSLPAATAVTAWTAVAEAVIAAGCRKLVLVSSHGGNSAAIDILALDLRARHQLLSVVTSWQRLGYPEDLFSESERVHGTHGGEIETSLMLAFRPDLVRMELAEDTTPTSVAMEREFKRLRLGRPAGFGWMAQDLSATGVAGNATAATAAKGEASADHGARAFVELLKDVAAFDLARLASSP